MCTMPLRLQNRRQLHHQPTPKKVKLWPELLFAALTRQVCIALTCQVAERCCDSCPRHCPSHSGAAAGVLGDRSRDDCVTLGTKTGHNQLHSKISRHCPDRSRGRGQGDLHASCLHSNGHCPDDGQGPRPGCRINQDVCFQHACSRHCPGYSARLRPG